MEDAAAVVEGAESLGSRLGRSLAVAGFNQKEAEERAGLSRGYLSRVLRGERTRIEAARLQALAAACSVDFTWLSTGRGTMRPHEAPTPDPAPTPRVLPADPVAPRDNGFEAALAEAFRRHAFALADLDAVRALLPNAATTLRHEPDLLAPATAWLHAAAALRRAGRPVTVETFALRLARHLGTPE